MSKRRLIRGVVPRFFLVFASAAFLVSACSSTTSNPQPPSASAGSLDKTPTLSALTTVTPVVTDQINGHVHHIALKHDTVYLGTHSGLWKQEPGQQPLQVSDADFDVMGLARTGTVWLASGHPGPKMQTHANLGLLVSTDNGRTWQERSLGGKADFHRLIARDSVVMGIDSGTGVLWRSENLGRTWNQLGAPPLLDIALSPTSESVVIGATPSGTLRSIDAGVSFTPLVGSPSLVLMSTSDSGAFGVTTDGTVYFSPDEGLSWRARGALNSQPTAISAERGIVLALVDNVVVESRDGGRTFRDRLVLHNSGTH